MRRTRNNGKNIYIDKVVYCTWNKCFLLLFNFLRTFCFRFCLSFCFFSFFSSSSSASYSSSPSILHLVWCATHTHTAISSNWKEKPNDTHTRFARVRTKQKRKTNKRKTKESRKKRKIRTKKENACVCHAVGQTKGTMLSRVMMVKQCCNRFFFPVEHNQ